ncbi:MAG: IS3 family transposase [Actinomycetia bacterium]|nr:IS3 family transposase [Actinomycetes bacterium]
MGRSSKYPDELRERAVRMVAEVRPQYSSQWAAITAVAGMLGIGTPETLRTWIRRSEVDAGQRPGVTSEIAAENKKLRQDVAELRRANEILKAAANFLRGRARPARETVIGFITEHKDHQVPGPGGGAGLRWGVEPMCVVLTEHGVPISASTYYEWVSKAPTKQELRDVELVEEITAQRGDSKTGKFVQTLGSRKLWIRLRGQGHDVARCTVERIMGEQGWEGACYGSTHKTTTADPTHERFPDLVDRNFYAPAPNRLWVADFTYVPTWTGFVYVAFVIDVFSRRIVGWRVAKSMTTALVLDAVEHAFFTRTQEGITDLTGLVAHNDAGSQYTSIAFTQRLLDEGIDPSVGSVGDALDNAMAETTVGSFKNELIRHQGPWRDVDHVEIGAAEWVIWFNTERPHEHLYDLTPEAVEKLYYDHRHALQEAG